MLYFINDSPLRPQSGRSSPLSRERGKASQMRGVSQDNATKQNATLFHSYYLCDFNCYFETSLLISREGVKDLVTLPALNSLPILKLPVCLIFNDEAPTFNV